MGQALFIIIAIGFAYKILTLKGVDRLSWYFAGILFFPPAITILSKPQITFSRFMIYVLLVSVLSDFRFKLKMLKGFPLKNSLILLLILLLFVGLLDFRVEAYLRVYRPLNYFIENFLVVAILYFSVRKTNEVVMTYRVLFKYMAIFCTYGLITFFLRYNPYYDLIIQIYGGRDFVNDNMVQGKDRFRISSFSWHALYYGLLLVINFLILVFVLTNFEFKKARSKIEKRYLITLCFFILLNIILVNSRTPIYILVLGFFIYIFFGFSLAKKIKIAILVSAVTFIAFSFVPQVNTLITESLNTFGNHGASYEGSSVDMRERQLLASYMLFEQSPIVGNGFAYIIEGLGYSSDASERNTGTDLMGFESYSFKLLIEQGLFGIIGNLVFFISMFIWFYRKYQINSILGKRFVVFTFSLVICFLVFILGTGDLGAFPIFMSILGLNLKAIQLNNNLILKKNK